MGIPVRSAVSILLALEKCVSWAFNQSTHWCLLKSSRDTRSRPRASANSCLHSRSSRSSSFTFSRYLVRLVSAGLSTLLLSTTTTEDTTELWGVGDVASSASIGVDPGNLVRLLLELSLESTLAPRRLDSFLRQGKGDLELDRMLGRLKQVCIQCTYVPLENVVQPFHSPRPVKMDSI